MTRHETWRAASALRDSGYAKEQDAMQMVRLGNITLAEEFSVEARLDRELDHKLDYDYWGDEGPPTTVLKKVDSDD